MNMSIEAHAKAGVGVLNVQTSNAVRDSVSYSQPFTLLSMRQSATGVIMGYIVWPYCLLTYKHAHGTGALTEQQHIISEQTL